MIALAVAFLFADARKDIESNYAAMRDAMHRKNVESVEKFLAPDYSATVRGRVVNRAQFIDMQRNAFSLVKSVDSTLKVLSVSVKGNEAVVLCTGDRKAVLDSHDGKVHRIESKVSRQDIWEKRGSSWLLKHVTTLKEQSLLDGKPVSLPGPG